QLARGAGDGVGARGEQVWRNRVGQLLAHANGRPNECGIIPRGACRPAASCLGQMRAIRAARAMVGVAWQSAPSRHAMEILPNDGGFQCRMTKTMNRVAVS